MWLVVFFAIVVMSDAAIITTRLFIVKLGGSSITKKDEFETLKAEALTQTAAALAEAWRNITISTTNHLLIVHGAGSFGHQHAHHYNIKNGGRVDGDWREGFSKTRESVTKLNRHVVSALVAEGLPAVSMSLFPSFTGALTDDGAGHLLRSVATTLRAGLLPVLHGDAILDSASRCTIFGGDLIMQWLTSALPRALGDDTCNVTTVFVTDVDGVYDRPPSQPGSMLLREILVMPNGEMQFPQTSALEHDVTGGVQKKLEVARDLTIGGATVSIVPPALLSQALAGTLFDAEKGTWLTLKNDR